MRRNRTSDGPARQPFLLSSRMQWVILGLIILIGAAAGMYYWSFSDFGAFADTPSYIDAWQNYLSHGNLDTFRTPLYPYYIGLCIWLGGTAWKEVLIGGQILCYLCAVVMVFRLLRRLICGKGDGSAARITTWAQAAVIYGVTLVIVLMPTFHKFLCLGATEGLAVIGSLCLCAVAVRFFSAANPWKWAVLLLAVTLAMVGLRPSLLTVPLTLIATAALLIWSRPYRRKAAILLSIGLITLAGVAVYCARIERLTGLYSPSTVGVINRYSGMRMEGFYFPELFRNPEIPATIDTINDANHCNFYARTLFEASDIIGERYGWVTLENYLTDAKTLHPDMQWRIIVRHAKSSALPPNYKCIVTYLLALLFTVFIIRLWRRRQLTTWRLPAALLMWIYVCGTITTSIIGAQSDWERLNLPAFAVVILMSTWQLGSLITARENSHPQKSDNPEITD